MTTDTPRDHDHLPLSVLERVDQVCDRFEAALPEAGQQTPRPRIEDYLGDTPQPARSLLLAQLLGLELEYRHAAGEKPSLEDYQARFPDHGEVVRRILTTLETVAQEGTGNPSAPALDAGDLSTHARFRRLRPHAAGGL